MYVNRSIKKSHTGTHSYSAKRLCQIFFVLLCAVSQLPHAYATTVKRIDTPSNTEAPPDIKKAPKLKGDFTTTQAVASPKLTLSTRISSVQLAGMTTVSHAKILSSSEVNRIPEAKASARSASVGKIANDSGQQYPSGKTTVEQELEYENRLLLGLTLIFITGLVIAYLISKYRLLL